MDSDAKRKQVEELFLKALGLSERQRQDYFDEHCHDEDVRAEVESLLEHQSAPFLETPPHLKEYDRGRLDAEHPLQIGPYKILKILGRGGMGIVYLAEQEKPIRRRVAIKLVQRGHDTKQVLARFQAERQALAMMDHPNIARVFDAGETEAGRPYFVMEYVEGDPITEYCDRHRLSTNQRLELVIKICEGVQHAHHKGVIHRDIKASNVLVAIQQDHPVPKIIDFGVAKAVSQRLTDLTLITEFGQLIGTPEYMSPEQAEMTGENIDTRTDIYSLGVLLYKLLVDHYPFDPEELRRVAFEEVVRKIREDAPPKPSTRLDSLGEETTTISQKRGANPTSFVRELRGDLDWITMKALEKDRTRRYANASDLAADIQHHLNNEPVTAGPPSSAYRLRKFVRRHRFGVASAALIILALALGVVGTSVGWIEAVRAQRETRREKAISDRTLAFLFDMFDLTDPGREGAREITARAVVDHGVRKIRDNRDDLAPDVRRRLLGRMGMLYRRLDRLDLAQDLQYDELELAREIHGNESAETATALNSVANVLMRRRRFDEARPYYEEALEIFSQLGLGEGLVAANTIKNLGDVAYHTKDYDEAVARYRHALQIRERRLPPDDEKIAKTLTGLGNAYRRTGSPAEAATALERSLRIRESQSPPDLKQVAKGHYDLALLFVREKDDTEALPHFEEAREIWLGTNGPEDLDAGYAAHSIAEILERRSEFALAAEAYFAARTAYVANRSRASTQDLALTLEGRARVLRRLGRVEEATADEEQARAVRGEGSAPPG